MGALAFQKMPNVAVEILLEYNHGTHVIKTTSYTTIEEVKEKIDEKLCVDHRLQVLSVQGYRDMKDEFLVQYFLTLGHWRAWQVNGSQPNLPIHLEMTMKLQKGPKVFVTDEKGRVSAYWLDRSTHTVGDIKNAVAMRYQLTPDKFRLIYQTTVWRATSTRLVAYVAPDEEELQLQMTFGDFDDEQRFRGTILVFYEGDADSFEVQFAETLGHFRRRISEARGQPVEKVKLRSEKFLSDGDEKDHLTLEELGLVHGDRLRGVVPGRDRYEKLDLDEWASWRVRTIPNARYKSWTSVDQQPLPTGAKA